jgi:transcriptional regulator with XRE-family HTH domain
MRMLKKARIQRGWTQQTLGVRARMTSAEISRIETGRLLPTPAQITRLARALRLAPAALLTEVSSDPR